PRARKWLPLCRTRTQHALHVVPTRRSSDLNAGHLQQRQRAAAGAEEHEAGLQLALAAVLGVLDGDTPAFAIALDALDALVVADIDRKRTRLNASHVKISYAVFCLEKTRGGA